MTGTLRSNDQVSDQVSDHDSETSNALANVKWDTYDNLQTYEQETFIDKDLITNNFQIELFELDFRRDFNYDKTGHHYIDYVHYHHIPNFKDIFINQKIDGKTFVPTNNNYGYEVLFTTKITFDVQKIYE